MPVWSFTTDPFERELIFRSSYIKEAKCQQKYFDSSLVNPYENVIPFFCFSVNHRRKALCILPHLTLSFRHFKTASRGELSGRSETVVSALRWLWFVYCITTESAAENQFCQALFVLCRGSTLSKSTYFPDRGTNSCLNLFWAINLVIWLLCLPMGSLSLFFDFSTFFAVASLSVYCHVYHVALGPPIKPPMAPLCVWLTLAKGEK